MRLLTAIAALLFVVSGMPSSVHAAEHMYWVDGTNGSDTNDGGETMPFLTIEAAVDAAAGASATIYLLEGTYEDGRIEVSEEEGETGMVYIVLLALSDNGDGTVTGMLEDPFLNATKDGQGIVDMDIGTSLTGDASWNGVILPPLRNDAVLSIPGYTTETGLGIEIGLADTSLELDIPARLTFEGQQGKSVGWIRDGIFTEITTVCDENPDEEVFYLYKYLIPDGSQDCKTEIEGEDDIYVWTKHFTTFVTYEAEEIVAPEPEVVSESSGRSRGASGRSGQKKHLEEEGEVLGAAGYSFETDLSAGMTGPDVIALQKALIAEGYSVPSGATGFFGGETYAAVMAYQKAHGISPVTGLVGPHTRAALMTVSMANDARAALIAELLMKVLELQKQLAAQSS